MTTRLMVIGNQGLIRLALTQISLAAIAADRKNHNEPDMDRAIECWQCNSRFRS